MIPGGRVPEGEKKLRWWSLVPGTGLVVHSGGRKLSVLHLSETTGKNQSVLAKGDEGK